MALTQVKSDGIATGAVTATQIATGAVTANDLEDSGVTAGTYGSSSAIPAITVDAKGRITSASTNSVTQVGGANGVDFNDNVKARFGTGNDLEIYHDGTNSWIRNATGELYFSGANVKFLNYAQNETMLWGTQDGAVQFYHDNSAKLATRSDGIDVTGTVFCDGLTCDGSAQIAAGTGTLLLKDNNNTGGNSTNLLKGIDNADAVKWYVGDGGGAEDLRVQNVQNGYVYIATNNNDFLVVRNTGAVVPGSNSSQDLGVSSTRWRNVYTNGILFNGDTADDNRLDDYEQGDWTPQFEYYLNGWNNVTFTNSPHANTGSYVKIGNLVHFSYYAAGFTINNGSGLQARISGLPYSAYNDSGTYSGALFYHVTCFNQTINSGYVTVGASRIDPIQNNSTAYPTWSSSSNLYLMVSGVYRTT